MLSKVYLRIENNTNNMQTWQPPGGTVFASYCCILFKQCFRDAIHAGTFLCVYGDAAFISCQPWGSSEIVLACVYLKCRVKHVWKGNCATQVASSLVLVCCHIHSSPWSFQVRIPFKPKDGEKLCWIQLLKKVYETRSRKEVRWQSERSRRSQKVLEEMTSWWIN